MLIRICSERVGLRKVTPKTLRYSFIMDQVRMGKDPMTLAIIAGLERVSMTRRYYDAYEEYQAMHINKFTSRHQIQLEWPAYPRGRAGAGLLPGMSASAKLGQPSRKCP